MSLCGLFASFFTNGRGAGVGSGGIIHAAPTNILLSLGNIVDNAAAGTVVGALSMVGGTGPATFHVVSPSTFTVSGGNLVRAATGTLTDGVTSVAVNCVDAYGHSVAADVTLSVTVTAPDASSGSNLITTLTLFDSSTVVMSEADGVSAGTMTDAATGQVFTFTDVRNHYPWVMTVIRGGDVPDVVIAYGGSSADTSEQAVGYAHPYTARVTGNGGYDSGNISVPYHIWGSTWDHPCGTHAIKQTISTLKAGRLVPDYDGTTNSGPPGAATAYAPQGFSDIGTYWPTTGDRPEIGLLTEWEAYYVATGNDVQSVIDVSRALGSFPTHLKHNNVQINLSTYPTFTTYQDFASWATPGMAMGDQGVAAGFAGNVGFQMDPAHMPHMGYLAYQLYRRPYFLRRFQDQTIWCQAHNPTAGQGMTGEGNQVRGDAWIMLSVFYCYLASPPAANCPAWLLSKEYWKTMLNERFGDWFDTYMMTPSSNVLPFNGDGYFHWGPNLKNTRFHSASSVVESSFKEDYLGAVMGYMAYVADLPAYGSDIGAWVTRFAWKVQWCIDRCSGLTGWDRRYPDVYYIWLHRLNGSFSENYTALLNANSANDGSAVVCADWADVWTLNSDFMTANWTGVVDPVGHPDGIKYYPGVGFNYQGYMRMQLVYAHRLGFTNTGMTAAYNWLVPQVTPCLYRVGIPST